MYLFFRKFQNILLIIQILLLSLFIRVGVSRGHRANFCQSNPRLPVISGILRLPQPQLNQGFGPHQTASLYNSLKSVFRRLRILIIIPFFVLFFPLLLAAMEDLVVVAVTLSFMGHHLALVFFLYSGYRESQERIKVIEMLEFDF